MGVAVGVSVDGVRIPLSRRRVAAVARAVLRAERRAHVLLSIAFVPNRAIRALNRSHLRRDRDTDVIAFAHRQAGRGAPLIADVYIAPEVARRNARDNGVSATEELVRLVVHGALHALGYDHPEKGRERSAMWKRQEKLVLRFIGAQRRRAPTGGKAAAENRQ